MVVLILNHLRPASVLQERQAVVERCGWDWVVIDPLGQLQDWLGDAAVLEEGLAAVAEARRRGRNIVMYWPLTPWAKARLRERVPKGDTWAMITIDRLRGRDGRTRGL